MLKRRFAFFAFVAFSAFAAVAHAELRPIDFKPELWKSQSKALIASSNLEPDPDYDGDANRELREAACKSALRSGLACEFWRTRLRFGADEYVASASFSRSTGLVELAIVLDLKAADGDARLERLVLALRQQFGTPRTSATQRGAIEIASMQWEQAGTAVELRRTTSSSRRSASLTLTAPGWSRNGEAH